MHSDTPMTSTFQCSDPMVNQLFRNIVWTQRSNFIDLPTDCPQRDERMGWTGDAQAYTATAAYNADIGAFYTKWLRELMASQRPSGAFPGYAPYPFQHGWDFGIAWADAGVICPWTIWQAYGDIRVIDDCWEPMSRFMQWRLRTSRDYLGVVHGNAWGDWLSQGEETPLDYIDTVYFAMTARMMMEMARATNRSTEATMYEQWLVSIRDAYRAEYLLPDGSLKVATQTALALAIYTRLLTEEEIQAVGVQLRSRIEENGLRMATGFIGTRVLLPALTSAKQNEIAVALLQSRVFPSWGYEIENGATTIWERWDSYTKEEAFGRHNAAMNSFSHYSFGAVCEWMFRDLAGIRSDGPGYRAIIIQPQIPRERLDGTEESITWVEASYDSIQGTIRTSWKKDGDLLTLEVEVPANTSARVIVPSVDLDSMKEGGTSLANNSDIRSMSFSKGIAELQIGSGRYQFESRLP
jgi:alpha-L-rhamnosidase